jgi:ABC-2 type transport system ATP-binding protein
MLDLIRDISKKKGIHVLLSTHILPDVEAVCDDVAIMDQGALVRVGPLAELGLAGDSGRPSWDVDVRGDRARFTAALETLGGEARALEDGSLRISCADPSAGTAPILKAAAEAGAQVRRLGRSRSSLDDLFARLVVESRSGRGPR